MVRPPGWWLAMARLPAAIRARCQRVVALRREVGGSAVSSFAMQRDGYAQPPRDPQAVSRRDLLRLGRGPLFEADIDYDGATERVRAAWDRDGREPLLRALEPVADAVGLARRRRPRSARARRRHRRRQRRAAPALPAARTSTPVTSRPRCSRAPPAAAPKRASRSAMSKRSRTPTARSTPCSRASASRSRPGRGGRPANSCACAEPAGRSRWPLGRRVASPGGSTTGSPVPRASRPRRSGGTSRGCGLRLEPLLDAIVVRTRTVTLEFDSADCALPRNSSPPPTAPPPSAPASTHCSRRATTAPEERWSARATCLSPAS